MVLRMRHFILFVALLTGSVLRAQVSGADLEKEITAVAAGSQVTVIHFWAPSCPNCKAEMTPEGWAKFVSANPKVQVAFVNVWHKNEDPARGLGGAGGRADP